MLDFTRLSKILQDLSRNLLTSISIYFSALKTSKERWHRYKPLAGLALFAISSFVYGEDKEKVSKQANTIDRVVLKIPILQPVMSAHNIALVTLAMERTVEDFGPYVIEVDQKGRTTRRVFKELGRKSDKLKLNMYIAVTSPQRESWAHAIKIPARMGLLNYRLIVTTKQHIHKFSSVETIEDLKNFKVGSLEQWSTTGILEDNGFNVVRGQRDETIFKMLHAGRYDYLIRGTSELYAERVLQAEDFGDAVVEPNLLIYLALPYYIFVAPVEQRLIERVEVGLERAIADGSFRALFLEHFGDYISKSQLHKRKMFYIENPNLRGNPALLRPELWYSSDEKFIENLKKNF